jgi:arsenical pump membrane protein
MLIFQAILAAIAVAALALRPRSASWAAGAAGAAVTDVATGIPVGPALALVAPLLAFLCAALTLAALVERSGLAARAAHALAAAARGSTPLLYAAVCGLCAVLTAIVSLDGAVVLMVPLLLVLGRRYAVPFAPLFLGVVVVANAASIAVPQGNPTNLVLIGRLGLSPQAFVGHMLVPGVLAAALCAGAVAFGERRVLAGARYTRPHRSRAPLSAAERHAAVSLVLAAACAWVAPLAGLAPWWPFTLAVVAALLTARERPRPVLPWRIATQIASLLIVLEPLGLHAVAGSPERLLPLILVAGAVGAAASIANNLPVSVSAAALLAGPSGYAATIGLAIGSLATPHGSVATLIAADLAGADAPPLRVRRLAPLAACALMVATLTLWAGP